MMPTGIWPTVMPRRKQNSMKAYCVFEKPKVSLNIGATMDSTCRSRILMVIERKSSRRIHHRTRGLLPASFWQVCSAEII
jgi:hypothetical protein